MIPKQPVKKLKRVTKKPAIRYKTGRPSLYSKELGDYICEQLMHGRSLTSILKNDPDMPTMPTIYNWLNKNSKCFEEHFLDAYINAREIQAQVFADEIKDIADDGSNDTYEVYNEKTKKVEKKIDYDNIKRSQLRVESRKWLAAHLLPRKFSDKMQITGAEGKDLIPSIPTKVVFNFISPENEKDN